MDYPVSTEAAEIYNLAKVITQHKKEEETAMEKADITTLHEVTKGDVIRSGDFFAQQSTFHVIIPIWCYFIIRSVCDYRIDDEINIHSNSLGTKKEH